MTDSERVACPLCGWWRTLDFGITAAGTPREVRFDKVDPASSPMWRLERLRGHGRERGKSQIQLIDAKGLLSLEDNLKQQIRQQCHRILDVLEGRTEAIPVIIKPPPVRPTIEPVAKKKPGPKKAPAEKKKKPAAPKEKVEKARREPEPESFGIWDTYGDREEATLERTKAMKRLPEYDWRVQPSATQKNKFELWWYSRTEQPKVKAEPAKKQPVQKVTTKPVKEEEPDMYSPEEITAAQSLLTQMQNSLQEDNKGPSLKKLRKLIDQSNEDMFEGLADVESAIEEYQGVERSGLTPEDYAEEKSEAFQTIQEALDDLELAEEVKDIIKKKNRGKKK